MEGKTLEAGEGSGEQEARVPRAPLPEPESLSDDSRTCRPGGVPLRGFEAPAPHYRREACGGVRVDNPRAGKASVRDSYLSARLRAAAGTRPSDRAAVLVDLVPEQTSCPGILSER